MQISGDSKKKGEDAEKRFREWLERHNIPYIYLQQDSQTISNAFRDYFSGKRPDFLILIPNFGFIFVDVKYRKINTEYKTFPLDVYETKKYSFLQRKFNLNVWYAISNESLAYKTWFWIPIAKVFESGRQRKLSSKSNMEFYAVSSDEFIQIASDDSLDRLFSKMFSK